MELDASARARIIDAVASGLVVVDREWRILVWNRWMVRHSGVEADVAQGRCLTELFPEMLASRLEAAIAMALSHRLAGLLSPSIHEPPLPLYRNAVERGKNVRLQQLISLTPIRNEGETVCVIQVQDVTAAVMRERRLQKQTETLSAKIEEINMLQRRVAEMSVRDPLTGAFDRTYFDNALVAAIEAGGSFALAKIDIDGLKAINRLHGRAEGDAIVQLLGKILLDAEQEGAIVGREGDDKFLLLLPGMDAGRGHACVDAFRQRFAEAKTINGTQATFTGGVVACPHEGSDKNTSMQQVSLALFLARHDGHNRVAVFDA